MIGNKKNRKLIFFKILTPKSGQKIATWKTMTSNSNANLLLPDADIAKSIVSTRGKNKNTLYQITDSQHI